MARARNIKPGLFTNEVLVDLPAFDRLLFIGLWCLADREGRLEDRVKRIKMELFPCDNYDIEVGLNNLAVAGFITRYTSEGYAVIEVSNFTKHQNPHGSEKDSDLPDINGYLTVNERKNKLAVKGTSRKIHVKELSNTVTAPLEPVNPPLDNALIPDCGFLIPDSLIPEQDQHQLKNACEEIPPAKTFDGLLLDEEEPEGQKPEEAPPPVDPKAPVEMTLDWMPDINLLKTYAVHYGIPIDLFTEEAVAPFTAHHESSGGLQTQARWVQLLVGWMKNHLNRASNVRQFPMKRQVNGPDFFDQSWRSDTSDDL